MTRPPQEPADTTYLQTLIYDGVRMEKNMDLEKWQNEIERRLGRCERINNDLIEKVSTLETRVDRMEGKMDTLLDSTSQIKMMLTENGKDSKSARRNAKGWGFISVLVTLVTNALKFISIL